MSYKIQISEQQRAIIQRAMVLYLMSHAGNPKFGDELPPDDYDEALALQTMIKELPVEEADSIKRGHAPGTTLHGFAL